MSEVAIGGCFGREWDDRAIWGALESGDRPRVDAALAVVAGRYWDQLCGFYATRAGMAAAPDLAQTVLLCFTEKARAGRLADRGAKVWTVLDRFAEYIRREHARRWLKRSRDVSGESLVDLEDDTPAWDPLDELAAEGETAACRQAEDREFYRAYRAAVSGLAQPYRRVYVLRHIRHRSPEEVAQELGLKRGTVDVYYSRAVAGVLLRLEQTRAVRKAQARSRARGAAIAAGRGRARARHDAAA
ncbi:MAG: sigma-70 family RNA polymerase sigma factor [Chloroflexi bacterium]|nr:sigma-70 family RNA polymerase sigma factor [Chloroflexota bacterium]